MNPPSKVNSSSSKSYTSGFMVAGPSIISNVNPKIPNPIQPILRPQSPISQNFTSRQFPPPTPSPSTAINTKTFIPTPTIITQASGFTNQYIQNQQSIHALNTAPALTSNIIYHHLTMPTPVSIPGFTFPEMVGYGYNYQQNISLGAGSNPDNDKIPFDASFSKMTTKINCSFCGQIGMSNIQPELGMASLTWCLLLSPLACTGLCCLCLPECKDKIHYCKCGEVIGYYRNSVC